MDDAIKVHPPLRVSPALARNLDAVRRQEISGDEARQALGALLQAALRLEFAIIPVYLSASFSLGARNRAISELLMRVAIEEMLHFIVVANTMNAIGIPPDIGAAVPSYPCDIDVVDPVLHLELRSFSPKLVDDLFLRVEAPEVRIIFDSAFVARPKTVGEFYEDIIEIIESATIPGLFDVDPAARKAAVLPDPPPFRQVAYRSDTQLEAFPLPASIDFRIIDPASAVSHFKWIVDQGEGTSKSDRNPIDLSGLPAHFYRFMSILKGRYLVEDHDAPNGFSYSGGNLRFDPADVHECDTNARVADYTPHGLVVRRMNQFNREYSAMIEALKSAFASADEASARAALMSSIGNMRRLPNMARPIYDAASLAGVKGGVPFEYQQA